MAGHATDPGSAQPDPRPRRAAYAPPPMTDRPPAPPPVRPNCSRPPSSRSRRSSSARTAPSSGCSSACWPAATACSKACPAWPRPSPSRPSPRWSAAPSPASSSRPTCCPPTSSAPASTGRRARPSTSSSGPVFANFVLADEINRAPAKVQSALLEVMAEHQVSIGGKTFPVPDAVPRARHPEPDRVRGRLPAARGPARPLPHEDRRSATRPPARRSRSSTAWACDPPAPDAGARPRTSCIAAPGRGRRGLRRPRRSSTTRSRSSSPPATRAIYGAVATSPS